MRQLTYVQRNLVEWHDVPEPRLQRDDDALVRPIAVARCDLDRAIVTGQAGLKGPFALGHEMVGEIVAIGDRVAGFAPGDRVIVPFQIACGSCAMCRRGLTASCEAVPLLAAFGMAPLSGVEYGGALSDLVRVPFAPAMLVRLPDGISPEALASAADNLPDGWRTVGPHLAERPGARVLVVGGGFPSVALYAVAAAVQLGAGEVVYIDHDPAHLALAQSLGAEARALRPAADTRVFGLFPITVDASTSHAGLSLALRSVEPGGVCTSVSIFFEPLTPLPLRAMYTRGVTLISARVNARVALDPVLELVARGLAPERVTSRIVQFADAAEAIFEPGSKIVFVAQQ